MYSIFKRCILVIIRFSPPTMNYPKKPENETQKGKMKNTKVLKSKRCENWNIQKINCHYS